MKETTNKIIYINARFLTQPITGVQRFAIEICRELVKMNISVQLLAPKNIYHSDLAKDFNTKIIGKNKGHLWEQLDLPLFLKRKGNNPILLNLCNTAPIFHSNCIITLHDLAFLKHPEWFSFAFRTYYNFLIPIIAKKATSIFTVSRSVKHDLHKYLKLENKDIEVIYNGLSSIFKANNENNGPNTEKPFFLAIGGRNPRKNLKNIIKAMVLLDRNEYDLHVICRAEENFNNISLGIDKIKFQIVFQNDVNDKKLKSLYSKAAGLLYPSLYEGFGIPPLEALNSYCPVLLSRIEVFEELYSGLAIFSDPDKPTEIRDGIVKLINKDFEPITPEKLDSINKKYSYFSAANRMQEKVLEYNSLSNEY